MVGNSTSGTITQAKRYACAILVALTRTDPTTWGITGWTYGFSKIVGASVKACAIVDRGASAREAGGASSRQCPTTGNSRATVVIDHLFDQGQTRCIIIIGNGTGGAITQAERDA